MGKTLRESLVDYDMAMLRALANVRGVMLTSNHQPVAVEELAVQLSTPTSVAIALTDLSPAEREALVTLQAAGGWMERPRFVRHFGAVRTMGPARLEREHPWDSPANPAEGLWYHGLIFKGFRQTEAGVVEIVYVPDDLLALLPEASPGKSSVPKGGVGVALKPTPTPPRIQPTGADLAEDVFGILVYVRNHDVRLPAPARPGRRDRAAHLDRTDRRRQAQVGSGGSPRPKDLQAINALFVSPVPAASVSHDDRLAFVLHLGRASALVTVSQGRLALNPDSARAWLQAPPARRLLDLQTAWRDDADWNDLWHVPSLKPQPTGWENDPILARRKVLNFLSGCQPGTWYGLDDLVMAVKATDPDFQRPDGDYTTWYIHDRQGRSLIGFEHWDEVEGALLRYLLSGPLHWLGATDLGFEENVGSPLAFRLAETGLPWLGLAPLPEESPAEGLALTVRSDFTVHVSVDANLYDRFQLSRFADFIGREPGRVGYRISSASITRARQQGITLEQVSAFLTRTSGDHVPPRVFDGMRRWYDRSGAVRLEQGVVLRVDHPETLKALRRDPAIARLLGDVLGPQAILVPRKNVRQVRRWLAEQGYLDIGE